MDKFIISELSRRFAFLYFNYYDSEFSSDVIWMVPATNKRKKTKSKLHYHQEIEVWFIIPAIHRNLAQRFKEHGLTQKKIAEILEVTEACVSQYLSGIRGTKVTFSDSIQEEIANAARRVHYDGSDVIKEVQKVCLFIKESGLRCELHRLYGKVDETCTICKDVPGE